MATETLQNMQCLAQILLLGKPPLSSSRELEPFSLNSIGNNEFWINNLHMIMMMWRLINASSMSKYELWICVSAYKTTGYETISNFEELHYIGQHTLMVHLRMKPLFSSRVHKIVKPRLASCHSPWMMVCLVLLL